MNERTQIEYKLGEIRKMLSAETSATTGGYGANLSHWSGAAKPINIDAGALQALYFYYVEQLNKEAR